MRLLFAIDVPGKRPTYWEHPEPDSVVKDIAETVRRGIEAFTIVLPRTPIRAAMGRDFPLGVLDLNEIRPTATFLGVEL